MRNKKLLGALLAVTTLATFGLAGCGDSGSNGSASKEDDKTITVAASPTPHAEILNKAVKSLVEKDGYKLEVKEFTDYVQPNTATEDGEVDANYFQHKPYLDNFNKEKGTHLVSVEATVIKDVDIAALNGNYAIQAGFDPTKDTLVTEKADGLAAKTYQNILVVKEGNENTAKTKELKKALKSDEVRDYINKNYKGAVVPVF